MLTFVVRYASLLKNSLPGNKEEIEVSQSLFEDLGKPESLMVQQPTEEEVWDSKLLFLLIWNNSIYDRLEKLLE